MRGGEGVGGGGERCGIGQFIGEQRGHLRGALPRAVQPLGQIGGGGGQFGGITGQPLRLFGEPVAQRGVPADIGAAIHVIANPTREPIWLRQQVPPQVRPTTFRCLQCRVNEAVARALVGTAVRRLKYDVVLAQRAQALGVRGVRG